ncbi:NAD-P-binding protein [Rhodofomes roseus]|uniref:NAD-P-binding protein n=1 Tax=Rhodofomes roseus TaxID=34475 RepID=A0ABQ8KQW3_9APHY|nr:NAD-P-binding protein [Rhodofomes roseus]KAH9840808.1 NAD-P-binding protein [Rhodofomes roseus]
MSRIAIVTGAAQGIGEAIAIRLGADGLDVVPVSDLPSKREQLDSVANFASMTWVVAMIDKTVETFGGLDVMVANAGILMVKPMFDTSVDDLNTILSINVRGVMLCYKYAAMQMVKQDAVDGSLVRTDLRSAPYPATLNQGFHSQHKITVNTYAPGSILTPMIFHPDDEKNGGPASTGKLAVGVPLDTPDAQPTVIADFVSYLIRPESYHITGQSVNINGGMLYD